MVDLQSLFDRGFYTLVSSGEPCRDDRHIVGRLWRSPYRPIASEVWTSQEARFHFNLLKLGADLRSVQGFEEMVVDHRILLRSVNSTVVPYLN